jgi:signal transduction histidine kinase
LVIILVGGSYLVVYTVIQRWLHLEPWEQPVVNLIIVLLLGAAFGPVRHRLEIVINRVLYGSWSDYRLATQRMSQTLDRTADDATLAETLCKEIQAVMRVECACLLWPNSKDGYVTCSAACQMRAGDRPHQISPNALKTLDKVLQTQTAPLDAEAMRELATRLRTPDELREEDGLGCARAGLWVPLQRHQRATGMLMLGARRGGGDFDHDDLEVLEVVVRHASMALENAYLIVELQQRIIESERLHRRVLNAGEEERKRIARELHDQIIQELVGLNYQVSELRLGSLMSEPAQVAQLQDEVRHILGEVRRICTDLRPPALDSLGLFPAVRSRVHELEKFNSFEVAFFFDGDEEQDQPDEIALCVYRVLQEALLNIQKHATAKHVEVRLGLKPDEVTLLVRDDGCGFVVPRRLGQLTNESHFGLVGLSERLELLNGTLRITSAPGQGTQLEARVPITVLAESSTRE